jgi:SAM-dependent methyltransferase
MRLVPQRSERKEWMDRAGHLESDLAGALRDIRLVNRFLGGSRTLLAELYPHLRASDPARPLRILDVGTGGGDLPLAMVRGARRLGRKLHVVAVDRDPATAAIAARETAGTPEVRIVLSDAFDLPFAPRSFDIVTASMFLHHFSHERSVRLLSSFLELARRAVLVNDLRRHVLPWGFVYCLSRATGRHAMFRHDAPLSVLRGFTPGELLRAARESGARRAELRRRWPFRLLLTLIRDGASAL